MNQPQLHTATSLVRRSGSRSTDRNSVAAAPSAERTTIDAAVAQLNSQGQSKGNPLTMIDDLRTARLRARHAADLRRDSLDHEARLRHKGLAIQAARLEAELDAFSNEQMAVLNATVLTSIGQLLQTMEAVRSNIEIALLGDRYSILGMFANAHAAGQLSDEELDERTERIHARFKSHDEQMAAEADRCIEDASRLLRAARR